MPPKQAVQTQVPPRKVCLVGPCIESLVALALSLTRSTRLEDAITASAAATASSHADPVAAAATAELLASFEGRTSRCVYKLCNKYFRTEVQFCACVVDATAASSEAEMKAQQGQLDQLRETLQQCQGAICLFGGGEGTGKSATTQPRKVLTEVSESSLLLFSVCLVDFSSSSLVAASNATQQQQQQDVWFDLCFEHKVEYVPWAWADQQPALLAGAAKKWALPRSDVEKQGLLGEELAGTERCVQILYNANWAATAAAGQQGNDKSKPQQEQQDILIFATTHPNNQRDSDNVLRPDAQLVPKLQAKWNGDSRGNLAAPSSAASLRIATKYYTCSVNLRFRSTFEVFTNFFVDPFVQLLSPTDKNDDDDLPVVGGHRKDCSAEASRAGLVALVVRDLREALPFEHAIQHLTATTEVVILVVSSNSSTKTHVDPALLSSAASNAQLLQMCGVEVICVADSDTGDTWDDESGAQGLRRLQEVIEVAPWRNLTIASNNNDNNNNNNKDQRPTTKTTTQAQEEVEKEKSKKNSDDAATATFSNGVLFIGVGMGNEELWRHVAFNLCEEELAGVEGAQNDGGESLTCQFTSITDRLALKRKPRMLRCKYYEASLTVLCLSVPAQPHQPHQQQQEQPQQPQLYEEWQYELDVPREIREAVEVIFLVYPDAQLVASEKVGVLHTLQARGIPSSFIDYDDDEGDSESVLAVLQLTGSVDSSLEDSVLQSFRCSFNDNNGSDHPDYQGQENTGTIAQSSSSYSSMRSRIEEVLTNRPWGAMTMLANKKTFEQCVEDHVRTLDENGVSATGEAENADTSRIHTCALPPNFYVDPVTKKSVMGWASAPVRKSVTGGDGDDDKRDVQDLLAQIRDVKTHGHALPEEERKKRAADLSGKLAEMMGVDFDEEAMLPQ